MGQSAETALRQSFALYRFSDAPHSCLQTVMRLTLLSQSQFSQLAQQVQSPHHHLQAQVGHQSHRHEGRSEQHRRDPQSRQRQTVLAVLWAMRATPPPAALSRHLQGVVRSELAAGIAARP